MLARYQKSLALISLASLATTTLFIAPGIAFDPFNAPRLFSLGAFCGGSLVALLLGLKYRWFVIYRTPLIAVGFFIFCLTLTLLFTDAPLVQQFFGASGRNTGYLAYFALAVQLLVAIISATPRHLGSFVLLLIGISFISSIYGFLQWSKLDPTPLENPSHSVVGFFGNQNFQSSFTAIGIIVALTILTSQKVLWSHRILLTVFIGLSIFQLFLADSTQGFMLVLASSLLLIYVRFVRYMKIQWIIGYLSFGLLGFFAVLLGTLNKGFLAKYVYEQSITYRGDFWRAAQQMTLEKPFFGVGLDSYGDWYRRVRTSEAALRDGPDGFSNSAHNIFLDFASTGGLLLLLAYLLITALTIRAVIKVLHRERIYNWKFTAIAISWFAFMLQSVISINQLGLGIWGWTFAGLIIGYEINTREVEKGSTLIQSERNIFFFSLFGLILGAIVSITPFRNSVELLSLSGEANITTVESLGLRDTLYPEISVILAANLANNKFDEKALNIIRNTVENFPNSYVAWKFFANLQAASPQEVTKAIAEMNRLDPLNSELE